MNEFVRVTSTNAARSSTSIRARAVYRSAPMPTWWSGIPASKTISVKTHRQNVDFNIFEGMTVQGCASHTVSGGKLVYEWRSACRARAGRYVERPAFAPYYDAVKQLELSAPRPVRR